MNSIRLNGIQSGDASLSMLPPESQYIKWSIVPFVITFITFLFYVSLFLVESDSTIKQIPIYIDGGLFAFLLVAATVCLFPVFANRRFLVSTTFIWLVALCRMMDAVMASIASLKDDQGLRYSVAQPPVALQGWILFFTAREYFGNALRIRDPQNNVPLRVGESQPLLASAKQPPTRMGLLKMELSCLIVLTLCAVGQAIIFFFRSSAVHIVHNHYVEDSALLLDWTLLLSGVCYILLKIAQMQSLAEMGIFFSNSHSNGFVWFLLLLGYAMRISINLAFQVFGNTVANTPNFDSNIYTTFGREVFTQFLPYIFHLFNIFQLRRYSRQRTRDTQLSAIFAPAAPQSTSIHAPTRVKVFLFLVVITMHFVGVGYVHEAADNCDISKLALAARSAGLVAAIDFCFVGMAFVAPLAQFLNYYFNITRYSVHKLNFHRNMSWSACLFASCHVLFHMLNWMNGNQPLPCHHQNATATADPLSSSSPLSLISLEDEYYSASNTDFITGMLMIVCFSLAFLSGTVMTRNRSRLFFFSLHIPLSCIGFLAFFVHGNQQILGKNIGAYIFEWTFILSIVVALLFFLFARVRELEVDPESEYGAQYIILSIKYRNSHLVPPAAFFNLYASQDSYASIFHCHSFPVFSTRNSRIVFLIKRRPLKLNSWSSSFTARLANDQPEIIKVQGPFNGPASSFLLSLSTAQNARTDKCVFLCGWNAGFASVFSLLEYFKDHARACNLQSVTCMFARIPDENVRNKIRRYVDELVGEWQLEIPLTIVEAWEVGKLVDVADAHDTLLEQGMDKEKWQTICPNCKIWFAEKNDLEERRRAIVSNSKVMYFCGNDFNYQQFREPKWQTFVESS